MAVDGSPEPTQEAILQPIQFRMGFSCIENLHQAFGDYTLSVNRDVRDVTKDQPCSRYLANSRKA